MDKMIRKNRQIIKKKISRYTSQWSFFFFPAGNGPPVLHTFSCNEKLQTLKQETSI